MILSIMLFLLGLCIGCILTSLLSGGVEVQLPNTPTPTPIIQYVDREVPTPQPPEPAPLFPSPHMGLVDIHIQGVHHYRVPKGSFEHISHLGKSGVQIREVRR